MTYAVDSNIIIDILIDDQEYAPLAIEALCRASRDGNIVACEVVWAEASSHFPDKEIFKAQMSRFGIGFVNAPKSGMESWFDGTKAR